MALNQYDRITLISTPLMQQRIQGALIKYALYLLGGSPTTGQAAWAKGCMDDPAGMARRVGPYLLDVPQFLGSGSGAITGDAWSGGSSISDADLGGAAETVVNARFVVEE